MNDALKRADGEDRNDWRNRVAKHRCDEFARQQGISLHEADGVVFVDVDGGRRVLHEAADRRLVWAEAYHVLIASFAQAHVLAAQLPAGAPKRAVAQRLTREQRRSAEVSAFLRQYARKAQAGYDPNDRHYSRKIEEMVKRMRAEDLDSLLNGEAEMSDNEQ